MKHVFTIVTSLGILGSALAQEKAGTPGSVYQKGVAAEKAGDAAAAQALYTAALKADPNSADARYSLAQLKIHYAAVAARGREAKFGAVMIPAFQMDSAKLAESLDALAKMVETGSKGGVATNFVVQDPKKLLSDKTISLNLKNTPAQAVLKYVLEQAGGKARFDEHAIVVSPR
jgi:hypothetical protein